MRVTIVQNASIGWFTGLLTILFISPALEAQPSPASEGPEGKRAFDDLAAFYADKEKLPPYKDRILELAAWAPATRETAGRYLLALLRQLLADESNGRTTWRSLPYWGGGRECDARELRKLVVEEFGEKASSEAAFDASVWLIDEDLLSQSQQAGITVLRRIKSSTVNPVFHRLLRQPHPNQAVLVGAIKEVGEQGLGEFGPEIARLCCHYRRAVRDAARAAALELGLINLPEFKPEDAFTPWLDEQLKTISAMVAPGIPDDAAWVRIVPAGGEAGAAEKESNPGYGGWLLRRNDSELVLVSWFGVEWHVAISRNQTVPRTLAEDVDELIAIRARVEAEDRNAVETLSRGGALTWQFEPRYISIPEALVAAWAYQRGDRASAAKLFFPRIDSMEDDRWLAEIVRDLLGHTYHRAMLNAFSMERDYAETEAYARHLSKPLFNGYLYQGRAKELLAQLENRRDDFKTLRLPTAEEWARLQSELDRKGQISYLAARLRLLNCKQDGQPGDVDYQDDQHAETFAELFGKADDSKGTLVINPYVELLKIKLSVGELPSLVSYLADENFMPTYGYWRDFHPKRTLHRVNWAVARILNTTAVRDLVDLDTYSELDALGKKQHLENIITWCEANAAQSREQLILDTLDQTKTWREFQFAANAAAEMRLTAALPILVRRYDNLESWHDDIAEFCFRIGGEAALAAARKWAGDSDTDVRFWAALTLVKSGNEACAEGLSILRPILADDDGSWWFERAFDVLLDTGNEDAIALACTILGKQRFSPTMYDGYVLYRLFRLGRQECLNYMIAGLDDYTSNGVILDSRDGHEIQQELLRADEIAEVAAAWHKEPIEYDTFTSEVNRQARRQGLKQWLIQQFGLVKAGKETELKTLPKPGEERGEWRRVFEYRIDAP